MIDKTNKYYIIASGVSRWLGPDASAVTPHVLASSIDSAAVNSLDAMRPLHIGLFGAPQTLQDDVPLTISRKQVCTLLRPAADLKPAARDSLCLRFSPDAPDRCARCHLSQLPGLLRSSLPDPQIMQTASEHYAALGRFVGPCPVGGCCLGAKKR